MAHAKGHPGIGGFVLLGAWLGLVGVGGILQAPFSFSLAASVQEEVQAAQNGVVIDMCEAIDTSGSIDEDELQLQIDGFKIALRDVLLPATQDGAEINLAIVAFGTDATLFLELTPVTQGTLDRIEAAYDEVLATGDRGKTNMGGAINLCAQILQADGAADRKVIDLSTDGQPTIGPNAAAAAQAARDAGIEVWTLGVGAGADNDFLSTQVAGCPPTEPNCGAQNFPVETFQQFGEAIRQKTRTIITGPNQGPVAVDDRATTEQETPVTIPVLDNDTDPNGDPLTVIEVASPSNGTAVANPDGTITYTPDPGFVGTDVFSYTISDGRGGTDTARVTVTVVTQLNDPPVARDDAVTTDVNTPVVVRVLANDFDPNPGDTLRVTRIVSSPRRGTVQLRADGTVRYTPEAGFLGTDTFAYEVCDDGTPALCDTATVTVEVAIGGGGGVGIPLLPPMGYVLGALAFLALIARELLRLPARTLSSR